MIKTKGGFLGNNPNFIDENEIENKGALHPEPLCITNINTNFSQGIYFVKQCNAEQVPSKCRFSTNQHDQKYNFSNYFFILNT